ncbi:septum formation initiator family protein [Streptomyces sp. NPDC058655]|uniref:septum formation initiator family protein n=1 Tax=Streptomyces sp. NPDC058655 TaxID=3346577 RepID=UPI00365B3A4A
MTPGGGKAGKFATLTRGRAVRVGRALGGRPGARPAGSPGQAARMPFVLLVVALLAGGLISLLLLNSALNEGSFQLSRLKKETTVLTDEEQALQRDVDAYSAPDALQRRAQELGLVPGGSPVFIGPDGKVTGAAAPAELPPPPSPAQSAVPAAPPAAASGAPGPAAPAPDQAPVQSQGRPAGQNPDQHPGQTSGQTSGQSSGQASGGSSPQSPSSPAQQSSPNPGR